MAHHVPHDEHFVVHRNRPASGILWDGGGIDGRLEASTSSSLAGLMAPQCK
jgi:hypothetical protein